MTTSDKEAKEFDKLLKTLKKDSDGKLQQPIFVNEDAEYCAYLAKFFKGEIKDESSRSRGMGRYDSTNARR